MAAFPYTLYAICSFSSNPGSTLWESDSSASSLSLNSFYSLNPVKPRSKIRTNRLMGFARSPERGINKRAVWRRDWRPGDATGGVVLVC